MAGIKLTDRQKSKVAQRLRNTLRELWSKSPYRSMVLSSSRVGRNEYRCAICSNKFPPDLMEVDHLKELPINSYKDVREIDWNAFIEHLFCDPNNTQAICVYCHAKKTASYNLSRNIGALDL